MDIYDILYEGYDYSVIDFDRGGMVISDNHLFHVYVYKWQNEVAYYGNDSMFTIKEQILFSVNHHYYWGGVFNQMFFNKNTSFKLSFLIKGTGEIKTISSFGHELKRKEIFSVDEQSPINIYICWEGDFIVASLGDTKDTLDDWLLISITVGSEGEMFYSFLDARSKIIDDFKSSLDEIDVKYRSICINLDIEYERQHFVAKYDLSRKLVRFLNEEYIEFFKLESVYTQKRHVFSILTTYNKKFYCAEALAQYADRAEYSDDNTILYAIFDDTQTYEISLMYFNLIGDFQKKTKSLMGIQEYLYQKCFYFHLVKDIGAFNLKLHNRYGYSALFTNSILIRVIKIINTLYREVLNNLYNEWKLVNKNDVKWGSEYTLYSLIKSMIPEAIYQYRPDWLRMQSLDIFLPKHMIAIEYQGRQHYEAVSYFGGQQSYEETLERDKRKRLLCLEHGSTVIDWKYSDYINRSSVKQFLLENNVDVLFK